jgi:hypothetical protein
MEHENEAAACFVVIQGVLGDEWCDYLGGLTILSSSANGQATTILAGQVADFAAFVGLISHLQNLGLTVLAITFHRLSAAPLA